MRRWLLHIAFILSAAITATGQAIAPAGTTDWMNSHLITSSGNLAYAVTYDSDKVYDLKRWDIGGWVDLGAISILPKHGLNPDGDFALVDMIYFKDRLYLAGKYNYLSGSAVNYVATWDGTSWTTFSDTLITKSADINKFVVLNDNLMLVGMFGGSPVSSNVVMLDNDQSWKEYGNLLTHDEANDYISDAIVYNGYIYVSGGFENSKGEQKILATLRNESWVYEGLVPFQNMTGQFGMLNGNIVLYGAPTFNEYDYFKKLEGSTWKIISNGLQQVEVVELNKMIQSGKYLWATGIFKDLVTSEFFSLMYYDDANSIWKMAETGLLSNDMVPLNIGGHPYIYGNFSYQDVVNFGKIYEDQALISGRIFEDKDGDCIWSAGDVPVTNAMVVLNPGGHKIPLNSDGAYRVPVDKGSYTISVVRPDYWESLCGASKSVSVTDYTTYGDVDFGIKPIPGKVDLYAHLTDFNGWILRNGSKEKIKLCVYNKGTEDAQNVEVILYIDESVSDVSMNPAPDQFDGTKALWIVDNIPAGSKMCIELTADIPANATGKLNFSYEINLPDGKDENTTDNTGSTSFDQTDEGLEPIFKSCGNGERIDMNADYLTYKIRIQNVGNSTIDRIIFRDTIDEDLVYYGPDWGYSFKKAPTIDYARIGNKWQWVYVITFDNINLVDSATSDLESIGYLDIFMKLGKGLHPKGTEICNTAYLKADNSEFVPTNTVCSVFGEIGIDEPDNGLIHIQPNPAHQSITLSNPVGEPVNVQIYAADGRMVKELNLKPFEQAETSVADLKPGVYFVRMEGVGSARFIKSGN